MSVTNLRDGLSCDKAYYKNRDGVDLLLCNITADFPCTHSKFSVQENRFIFRPSCQRCPNNEIISPRRSSVAGRYGSNTSGTTMQPRDSFIDRVVNESKRKGGCCGRSRG
jgi:hypothetical protein